jgi:hypothetical protein|tara:strand:+ start:19365 stop:19592 length:228 start_codon:yes stop_codon:yes gene_type:complete
VNILGLTTREKKALKGLKRETKGTKIKVKVIRGTSNVRVTGGGFKNTTSQLAQNTRVSLRDVIKARKRLNAKRRK